MSTSNEVSLGYRMCLSREQHLTLLEAVSESESATEYPIKLQSMKVTIDVTSYYGCKRLCSSTCHRTV